MVEILRSNQLLRQSGNTQDGNTRLEVEIQRNQKSPSQKYLRHTSWRPVFLNAAIRRRFESGWKHEKLHRENVFTVHQRHLLSYAMPKNKSSSTRNKRIPLECPGSPRPTSLVPTSEASKWWPKSKIRKTRKVNVEKLTMDAPGYLTLRGIFRYRGRLP